MKPLRLSCLLVLALFTSEAVFASEVKPSEDEIKKALAIEYLTLSQTREAFDASIDTYARQIAASDPSIQADELRAFFNQMMGWGTLEKPYAELVAKHFTAKELKAINDFYRTEAGRSLADRTPLISSEASELLMQNMQKALAAAAQ